MNTTSRIFAAIASALGLLSISLAALPSAADSLASDTATTLTQPDRHLSEGSSVSASRLQEAEELLAWGRQRYAEEGLELPEITLVVHTSLQPCNGRVGRYIAETKELVLCRIDRNTVLHELAHAWTGHNLDSAERAHLVELRGTDAWNDHTDDWADRGTEHAAEILVWALSDQDLTVQWTSYGVESRRLLSIGNSSPASLAAGFETMVGHQPSLRTVTTPHPSLRTVTTPHVEPFSPEG
jgi:hypothetical protein